MWLPFLRNAFRLTVPPVRRRRPGARRLLGVEELEGRVVPTLSGAIGDVLMAASAGGTEQLAYTSNGAGTVQASRSTYAGSSSANLSLNARNNGYDPYAFIDALPLERVWQLHIAGGSPYRDVMLDTHSRPVAA